MPLEQAIYSSNLGKIYGIRGQWVYEYDTSGALIRSGRWCDAIVFDSSICEIGGKLYMTTNLTDSYDGVLGNYPNRDIWVLDLVNWPVATQAGFSTFIITQPESGWTQAVTDGTYLYAASTDGGIIKWNPTLAVGTHINVSYFSYRVNLDVDAVNNLIIHSSNEEGNTALHTTDFVFNSHDVLPYTQLSTGVSFCALTTKAYSVQGNFTLTKHNINEALLTLPGFLDNYTWVQYNTGRINCTARRVRCCNVPGNPYYGKVLIPAWKDDTVLVWDSATDLVGNMVVKSGFTAPIDVVYTPTKAFAVQNSPVGLLEIT